MNKNVSVGRLMTDSDFNIVGGRYFSFYRENYFTDEVYVSLRDSFPDADRCNRYESYQLKHAVGTLDGAEFIAEHTTKFPLWGSLISFFRSAEYLDDVRRFIGNQVEQGLSHYYDLRRHEMPWTQEKMTFLRKMLSRELSIQVDFEFSMMHPGDYIDPHSDAKKKLLSQLFYFPSKDWRPEYGGNTIFYEANSDSLASKWAEVKNKVPLERIEEFRQDHEVMLKAPMSANRTTGFVKNRMSFHEVRKIECPQGITRNVFIVNINVVK